jgi:serine/threonine-protein kinase
MLVGEAAGRSSRRSRPSRRLIAFVLATSVASPSLAHGQTEPTQSTAGTAESAAESLFVEGKRLVAAGSFAEGCAKLAESERLAPAAGTLLNLADCYEKNGQTASAWVTFRQAAALAQRFGRQAWADQATSRAGLLESHLSTLTVQVDPIAAPPGLEITCNDVAVAPTTWGLAVPLDPSHLRIEAHAPNRGTWSTTVTLDAAHPHIVVTVPPLALAATAPGVESHETLTPPTHGSTQRVAAASSFGVGIVGLGVAGALLLGARGKQDQAEGEHGPAQTQDSRAAVQQGNVAEGIAIGSVAMVAAGVLLWVTIPKSPAKVVVRGPRLSLEAQF